MAEGTEKLLSVVLVSYRDPSLTLRRAVRSVQEQSYRHFELILVDANEEGDPYSLGLREDMALFPRVRLLACPCPGGALADAKNCGARAARGEYLAFLLARFAWNPVCAEMQIACLEEHPEVGMTFCSAWRQEEDALSESYRRPPQESDEAAGGAAVFDAPASGSVSQVLFRRSVFEELDGFDRRIRRDDHDLWLRVLKRYRILSVDRDLVCRYVERSTLRRSHRVIDVVGYLQLYSKHKELYDKNPQAKLALFEKIAACYRAAHSVPDWLRFAAKVRLLRWRLSGSAAHAAAVLPPPGEPGESRRTPEDLPLRLFGCRRADADRLWREGGEEIARLRRELEQVRAQRRREREETARRRQEQADRELELAGRESKAVLAQAGREAAAIRAEGKRRAQLEREQAREETIACKQELLELLVSAQRQRGARS